MIDQYMKNLREKLNEVCRNNGKMQKRIAAESGVSARELRRIMTGQVRDVRLSTFIGVAKTIGLTVDGFTK